MKLQVASAATLLSAFVAAACERPADQPPSATPQSVELSIPSQPELPGGAARPSVHPAAVEMKACDDVLRAIKRCYEDSPSLAEALTKAWLRESRDALEKGGAAREQLLTRCKQTLASFPNGAC